MFGSGARKMTAPNAFRRLLRLVGALLGVIYGSTAFAQVSLPEVQNRFANSTVFIAVKYETLDGQTPTSGCKKGSGFVISETGYVATSYHLFTDDKNRPFDKISAVLGKVGESFDCDQPLGEVVRLDRIVSTAEVDAALLKFVSPKVFVPIRACLGSVVPNGNSLYVLGFPLGLPLASQTVIKSNETGKQWQIAGKFDSGSSGGPVISTDGTLVGLVFGSYNGTNISYVVPLNYFANFFQAAGLQLRECKTVSEPKTGQKPAGSVQESIFPRMVGKWRELTSASTIIVDPDGKVFSAGSPIFGSAGRSIEGGGNFAFENASTRCVYDVTFLGAPLQGATSWGLRSEKILDSCPKAGTFVRVPPETNPPPTAPTGQTPVASSVAKDVEEAKKTAQPTSSYMGPRELENINVIYFQKAEDQGKVAKALSEAGVPFSTRDSVMGIPANVITCTADVPVAAVKRLGFMLMDAGITLRAIRPSIHPEFPKRMSIEAYSGNTAHYVPITRAQLSQIETCTYGNDIESHTLRVKNDCSKTQRVKIHVMYANLYASGKWETVEEDDVAHQETRTITDDDGDEIASLDSDFFVHAEGVRSDGRTIDWPGRDDDNPEIGRYKIPSGAFKYFRRIKSDSWILVCGN
jgi:hypothetical protein